MKRQGMLCLILTAVLALGAAGCTAAQPGPEGTPAASGPDGAQTPSNVKIGILIPGSPTDGGFCQQAAEAGKNLEKKYGYAVSVVEVGTTETMKQEAENMASDTYQIVFGHGGQFSAPFAEICGDYPDTCFITFGGTEIRENLFPVCMCAEEGTYVMGVVAGLLTKTGVIAYSVAGDYPAYVKTPMGWALGAKSVNSDLEVKRTVLNSPDSNEAYETTMNQIQAGADMIFSNTNAGQAGSIKAVSESENVYTFGSLGNFFSLAPDRVLMNAVCDYSAGYENATQMVIDGALKPEIMYLTIANGCVDVTWNEELKAELPDEVVEAAEQAYEDIKAGKIDVPNEYEQDKALEKLDAGVTGSIKTSDQ